MADSQALVEGAPTALVRGGPNAVVAVSLSTLTASGAKLGSRSFTLNTGQMVLLDPELWATVTLTTGGNADLYPPGVLPVASPNNPSAATVSTSPPVSVEILSAFLNDSAGPASQNTTGNAKAGDTCTITVSIQSSSSNTQSAIVYLTVGTTTIGYMSVFVGGTTVATFTLPSGLTATVATLKLVSAGAATFYASATATYYHNS